MTTKRIDIDPELAYELVIAALDVVGSVSPAVHDRVRREVAAGKGGTRPGVNPATLVALRDVLNRVGSGGLADTVITKSQERRTAR